MLYNPRTMWESRESHTLRFSRAGWRLISERAKALFGSEENRARYLENLALKEKEENELK
jgi:hypothetical protein